MDLSTFKCDKTTKKYENNKKLNVIKKYPTHFY